MKKNNTSKIIITILIFAFTVICCKIYNSVSICNYNRYICISLFLFSM